MERNKHQPRVSLREPPPRVRIPKKAPGVPPIQPNPLAGRPVRPISQGAGRGQPQKRPIIPQPTPGLRGPAPPHHHHHHLHLLRLARHPAPSQSKKKKMNGHHLPKKSQGQRPKRLRPLMMIMMSVLPRRTLRNSKPKRRKRLSTRKRRPSLSIARRSKS